MDTISPVGFFLQGAALGVTAAATPGPFQTFLISETLKGGWHQSLPITLAPLLTDLPIILVSLFFLDHLPDNFLKIINIFGGLFVLYLAWSAWRDWRAGPDNLDISNSETRFSNGLLKGMLMNFLKSRSIYLLDACDWSHIAFRFTLISISCYGIPSRFLWNFYWQSGNPGSNF